MRFRELTRFDGVLRLGAAGMEVHLVSHMHIAPKMCRIITSVLGTITASAPPLPDGSGLEFGHLLGARTLLGGGFCR